MNSITIITIVVVALLTFIIFGLSWAAYISCIKAYRMEVLQGKHDEEIKKEYRTKKKKKGGLLGLIGSWAVLFALMSLFVTGVVYKARGENFSINNQVALVIKSGSMSDFYNDKIAEQYNYDRSLQFDVGDICTFDKVAPEEELTIGDVYGYKYKNIVITHRLTSVYDDFYLFRGDNNVTFDGAVSRDKIIYHYTGQKIPGIGSFVLYAQSYFGMWSLAGMVGVAASSEAVYHKIDMINKQRNELMPEPRKVKVKFKRRDGSEAIIYEKRKDGQNESK